MFSVRFQTCQVDDELNGNDSILNTLMNDKVCIQEENSIHELRKQIFGTIQVNVATWDGKKVLIVLIEDATDQTQLQLMQAHDKEKKQQ